MELSNEQVEKIAQVAHDLNAAYCRALHDYSQLPWKHAPKWQKESAIQGVEFHLNDPQAKPAASHENWLKQKDADGWVWGAMKDPEKKRHPCIMDFDELPEKQRAKDHLFKQVVNSLADY